MRQGSVMPEHKSLRWTSVGPSPEAAPPETAPPGASFLAAEGERRPRHWLRWERLPAAFRRPDLAPAIRPYYEILAGRPLQRILKRGFDVVCSLLLMLLLLLPCLLIALRIRLDGPGPIFFRQIRVGRYGGGFRIWKFRTMRVHAEELGTKVTVDEDPRITRSGRRLRKYRLDEIPQLINIFLGEMSFVGTRPEAPCYAAAYRPEDCATLLMPPGLTSTASLTFKDESVLLQQATAVEKTYVEEILPRKMARNLADLEAFGILHELGVLVRTLIRVFVHG